MRLNVRARFDCYENKSNKVASADSQWRANVSQLMAGLPRGRHNRIPGVLQCKAMGQRNGDTDKQKRIVRIARTRNVCVQTTASLRSSVPLLSGAQMREAAETFLRD